MYEYGHRVLRDWTGLSCTSASHGDEPWGAAKLGLRNMRLNDAVLEATNLYHDPDAQAKRTADVEPLPPNSDIP